MAYISKYDTKFLTFVNRKYSLFRVNFEFFDDYVLWLYYEYFKKDEESYYKQLESDIMEYSNFQTGKERDKRGKLNGDWQED